MSPVAPQPRDKVIRAITRAYGWEHCREGARHTIYVKDGVPTPIVVPRHKFISPGVLKTIAGTLGVSLHEFFETLRNC